jgi:glycosidase
MRKDNPVLAQGDLEFILADDKKLVLAYSRKSAENEIVVIFNRSDEKQFVTFQDPKMMVYFPVFRTFPGYPCKVL